MSKPLCFTISLFSAILITTSSGIAQIQDSSRSGTVAGVIADSAYKYSLQFASVALYSNDSILISYQLADDEGKFRFAHLPVDVTLTLRAFNVGYFLKLVKFRIPRSSPILNLDIIKLSRNYNELQEVIVNSIIPVRMKGDTLEFNANAFKLDKNAVAEDLFKQLPGVTVWADGSITVNGKVVNQVLVDGRPFFGKDPRIAIQNIGKSAIDKVQIYQNVNSNNILDSITSVNIKLKKNDNAGYFGKIEAGIGTDSRYANSANINLFKKRSQIGIAAGSNNVNKIANDVNIFLKNSTYKDGAPIGSYQSDFTIPGINRTYSAGIIFQQDFQTQVNNAKKNLLDGSYYFNKIDNNTTKEIQSTTAVGTGSVQYLNSNSIQTSSNTPHRVDVNYLKKRINSELKIAAFGSSVVFSDQNSEVSTLMNESKIVQSKSTTGFNYSGSLNKIVAALNYNKVKNTINTSRIPGDFQFSYAFGYGDFSTNRASKSSFVSVMDMLQNKSFDRNYVLSGADYRHTFNASFGDLSKLLFGYKTKVLSGLGLFIENFSEIIRHNEISRVGDFDSTQKLYVVNRNITENSNFTTFNTIPGLRISKTFSRSFEARYQKVVFFNAHIQNQFFQLNSNSTQSFRNFSFDYSKFVPLVDFGYSNYQYGEYQDIYNAKFKISVDYPTVAQLAPLIDSLNLYRIKLGNRGLRPANQKELLLSFEHNSFRSKNTFKYRLEGRIGFFNDGFSDSIIVDNLGRSSYYTVNANGRNYVRISGSLNKAFVFPRHNQLQFAFFPSLSTEQIPSSSNNVWNIYRSINFQNAVDVLYTYRDVMSFNLRQSVSLYSTKQESSPSTTFRSTLIETTAGLNFTVTRKLSTGSNIKFSVNKLSNQTQTKFSILNINAGYRFLKNNNLEIKFWAMDLLHQNTGIANYGDGYKLSTESTNVLQQYFIVSLSYFPRKFGKSGNGNVKN